MALLVFMMLTVINTYALPLTHLAGGSYTIPNHDNKQPGVVYKNLPWILKGENDGQFWSAVNLLPILPDLDEGWLNAIACKDSHCVSMGRAYFKTAKGNGRLVLLNSDDSGTSWSLAPTIADLPGNTSANIVSIICPDKTCIAIGEYDSHPLLLTRDNNQKEWTRVKAIDNQPSDFISGSLINISCNNTTCVAIGDHETHSSSGTQPLLLVSNNSGQSWSYVNNISHLPSKFKKLTVFDSVNCSEKVCVVGGTYDKGAPYKFPMMLVSKDKGISWSFIAVADLPYIPSRISDGSVMSVSCNENLCVAVGDMGYWLDVTHHKSLPMILVSKDSGDSWLLRDEMLKNIDFMPQIVSCSNKECLIGGELDKTFPAFMLSKDKGTSWQLITRIAQVPKSMGVVSIHSLGCTNDICFATGSYYSDNDINDEQPLLLNSQDGGQSWSFIQTIANLPAKKKKGTLCSGSASLIDHFNSISPYYWGCHY